MIKIYFAKITIMFLKNNENGPLIIVMQVKCKCSIIATLHMKNITADPKGKPDISRDFFLYSVLKELQHFFRLENSRR